jgi:acetyl esterase
VAALSATPSVGGKLEPATQVFIDSLASAKPIYTLSPEAARAVLADAQKAVPVTFAPASVQDRVLNVGPKGRTNIRLYRPAAARGALPAVVYTHGGGWVLGDRETHDRLVRELTVWANAVVVFVDYDRSPESHYPVAVEESYEVLKYVAQHPDEFGADASRIAIAGDSVGGNMTAAIALLAKERKGPAITAQLLFYPVTDASIIWMRR